MSEIHLEPSQISIIKLFPKIVLCEKSPYSEFFWSVFFHIESECGQIRTRETPNTNTFG